MGKTITKEKPDKQYKTTGIVLKASDKETKQYCENNTKLAKLFKNAVIFRCRQLICAHQKNYENLSSNELEVLAEFANIDTAFMFERYWTLPNYYQFDAMFKITNNSDYYNDLAMQTKQQIIKDVLESFQSYRKSLFAYYKEPSKFTGKPKLPGYVKSDRVTFTITNQDAKVKSDYKKIKKAIGATKSGKTKYKTEKVYIGEVLKLPKTKKTIKLGKLNIGKVKEVQIEPFYDTYKILIVEELPMASETKTLNPNRILGIDLGVNNFVSTSNNCGLTPFVINGNGIKSYNQWYNKTLANLKSNLPNGQLSSNKIQALNKKRHNVTNDFYNKVAHYVVDYCVNNDLGTIVVGKNTHWKQEIHIGKENNQNFCYLAHSAFISKPQTMAQKFGINVIVTEESYTSKASFLDGDYVPTYGVDDQSAKFSGKRIHRGLYETKNKTLINADVNGASNTIRKAIPNAFDGIKDFGYLYKTTLKIDLYKRDLELQIKNRKTKTKS